jgi:hypothetical protein
MDNHKIQKLRNLGAISRLDTGEEGVRVSLQYKPRLDEPSRTARRDILHREFEKIASECLSEGTQVDLGSLSVSGQTVEAVLPVKNYDRLVNDLEQKDVRVDDLINRQVIPEP